MQTSEIQQQKEEKFSEQALYLDLMKRCLTNSIYQDAEYQSISMTGGIRPFLGKILRSLDIDLVRKTKPELRAIGIDWPHSAHTMVGIKRLDNLQFCVEEILKNKVPGDLIETGVWRGGASILMRAVLKIYGITDRTVYVADSFEGLPKRKYEIDKQDPNGKPYPNTDLAVPLEQVQSNFKAYGLLDDQVRFVKGWFSDTLPRLPTSRLAVARLDGDFYESTMDSLVNLYPKLSVGGFLIVDDFDIQPCKQAVQDYREKYNIREKIQTIDWTGIFWQRTS
jgi:hypothetical protein